MPASREHVLSLVGKALASLGHELNNIVGVVHSYAAFIQEGTKEAAVVADAQVIRASADKAAVMARQLLAFGHPREQDAEALELGPFLIDVQGFLRRALGDECEVSLQLGSEPVVVLTRRASLGRQLLDETISARATLSPGASLRLAVALVERDGARLGEISLRERYADGRADAVRFLLAFPALDALQGPEAAAHERASARGTETVLIVEENGELRSAICRMLEAAGYRALEAEDHATARSLGLEGGVAVDLLLTAGGAGDTSAEQLAEELRHLHPSLGLLRQHQPFSSAELQGAVRAALDDRRRVSQQVPADASRVLALVVDDDPHVRLALSRILSDVGADVVTAPSGLHALQKLEALPIDVVIADQLMPGMEGTRLLETAYKTWPRVMRVVYTGYLSSALVVDAVNRANVHKVLAKDMPREWLRAQLSQVIDEIRGTR